MKFIGLPKTVKKGNDRLRSAIGGVLLFSLIIVCVVGAESVLTGPRLTTTNASDTSASSSETSAASLGTLDINATVPGLAGRSDDVLITPGETTAVPTVGSLTVTAIPSAAPTGGSVTETAASGHYYVTASLTVRKGPGTEFDKVGAYAAGDELDVVAKTSNNWMKIADGKYVTAEFLSLTPPEKELIGTFYAIGEINVRKGPGTEYDIVKTLSAGDAISVVSSTTSGWYRTAVGTYVRADMCSSTPPATPTPTPRPTPSSTPRPTPTPKPTPRPTPVPGSLTYIGTFKITYYGPQWVDKTQSYNWWTSSGTYCKMGRTIAVDPDVIKAGTKVYIKSCAIAGNGGNFVAEDSGTAIKGHVIDIFADDGETGPYGTKYDVKVYIVNK